MASLIAVAFMCAWLWAQLSLSSAQAGSLHRHRPSHALTYNAKYWIQKSFTLSTSAPSAICDADLGPGYIKRWVPVAQFVGPQLDQDHLSSISCTAFPDKPIGACSIRNAVLLTKPDKVQVMGISTGTYNTSHQLVRWVWQFGVAYRSSRPTSCPPVDFHLLG